MLLITESFQFYKFDVVTSFNYLAVTIKSAMFKKIFPPTTPQVGGGWW